MQLNVGQATRQALSMQSECCCRAHIEHEFNKLRSSNTVSVRVKSVGDWWEADPESKLFRLAERALAREWNVQPLFVREGGTMPVSMGPPKTTAHLQDNVAIDSNVNSAFVRGDSSVQPCLAYYKQTQN